MEEWSVYTGWKNANITVVHIIKCEGVAIMCMVGSGGIASMYTMDNGNETSMYMS